MASGQRVRRGGEHAEVAARSLEFGVGEVAPLGQEAMHRLKVLIPLRLVQHDLPLAIKLGCHVRRQARADSARFGRGRVGLRPLCEGWAVAHPGKRDAETWSPVETIGRPPSERRPLDLIGPCRLRA